MIKNIEFFTHPDGSVWYKNEKQDVVRFEESDKDLVDYIFQQINDFYPKAFGVLSDLFSRSVPNIRHFRYRIVHRFIRCNFGVHDTLKYDIDGFGMFNIEEVCCPLRGECQYEGVICRPRLHSKLSEREKEVLKLLSEGKNHEEISKTLIISMSTVARHVDNIKKRLGISRTSLLIKIADKFL